MMYSTYFFNSQMLFLQKIRVKLLQAPYMLKYLVLMKIVQ